EQAQHRPSFHASRSFRRAACAAPKRRSIIHAAGPVQGANLHGLEVPEAATPQGRASDHTFSGSGAGRFINSAGTGRLVSPRPCAGCPCTSADGFAAAPLTRVTG